MYAQLENANELMKQISCCCCCCCYTQRIYEREDSPSNMDLKLMCDLSVETAGS